MLELRDTYQWLSLKFNTDKNEKVNIQTRINHLLALPEYRLNFNSNHEQKLQVIAKVQSFNLKVKSKR